MADIREQIPIKACPYAQSGAVYGVCPRLVHGGDVSCEECIAPMPARPLAEQVAELERRLTDLLEQARLIRIALAALMRCRCPVGFGAESDPSCPRHGTGAR